MSLRNNGQLEREDCLLAPARLGIDEPIHLALPSDVTERQNRADLRKNMIPGW